MQGKFLGLSRELLLVGSIDANYLAFLLLFPFAFSLALLMYRSSVVNTMLGIAGASAIGLAIVFTQSRGGYLGLLVMTIPFFFQLVRSKALACVIIILFAGGLYSMTGIAQRLQGVTSARFDASAAQRFLTWRAGVDMALDRPFVGVGMTEFEHAVADYSVLKGRAAHSTWFSVLGETGLPGFILFLSLIGTTFRSLFRTASALRQAQVPPIMRAVTAGFTLTLIGFCVVASFLSSTWSLHFYVVIGFSAALSRYVRDELLQPGQS
jgi:O-antigen ligase